MSEARDPEHGPWLPAGGGEVAELMRSLDWSGTDVGPPDTWPRALRSYVSMILEMPTPAIIFWGPNQTQLYNDGYAVIMGPRHPRYLAASYEECWPDTYPLVYPHMKRVLAGETWEVEDQLFVLTRHGFAEEAYFTFTFSPLRDDRGRIAGIFQPVVEVTDTVLGARRAEVVRKLAAQLDTPLPRDSLAALEGEDADIPFAIAYLVDASTGELTLASHVGLGSTTTKELGQAPVTRVAREAFHSGEPRVIEDVESALGRPHFGRWPDPTGRALALPLRRSSDEPLRGVVVLGVSPRLHFDPSYRSFLAAVARELATRAATDESKRVERELLDRERAARREAELQKEHLSELLSQAPTPMVVLRGRDLVIELANPHACNLWMREPEQVVGKPLFDALPEIRDQVFQELLESVYRTGEAITGREVLTSLERPEGGREEVYLNFVYSPLRTPSGEVDGILVIAFDVTEQVRAREQVDELRDAAEAANRAKDEFFAILGHELRNPLAPILTALQLMRMRGTREIEAEREMIERQANHLVRLVDDLLDVSRVTRGKIELRSEVMELADAVSQALEMALPMIEQRRHELVVDVPSEGLAIEADAIRIAQAISNLLTNAAKYTEPGGHVSVAAARRDGHVELTVRDDGIGLSAAMLPRVFDVFVQERQALDRSQGGLGLGLAIVRGIVELHGGSVAVASEGPGRGAEFTIRLPAAEVDAVRERPSRPSRAVGETVPGRTVLVVDDNEDAAQVLASALSRHGHEVHTAHDGPSALEMAAAHPPEVALLDIGLPVMDGYELARRLRDLPGLETVSMVAVTGYGQSADRERALEAGFDRHLVKPVDLTEVAALVATLPSRPRA